MRLKEQIAHMTAAYAYANLSYCKRRKVGCVLVKNGTIISIGYNGMPRGEDNECEDCNGVTNSNVIHAEENALRKLIKRTESSVGCQVFVTKLPCEPCAEKLVDAEVESVYYVDVGSSIAGMHYLNKHRVSTTRVILK